MSKKVTPEEAYNTAIEQVKKYDEKMEKFNEEEAKRNMDPYEEMWNELRNRIQEHLDITKHGGQYYIDVLVIMDKLEKGEWELSKQLKLKEQLFQEIHMVFANYKGKTLIQKLDELIEHYRYRIE